MKHVITSLMFFLLTSSAFAASQEKQFEKLLKKYDVSVYAIDADPSEPSLFWQNALERNALLEKFNWDILKMKGAEKEAMANYNDLAKLYPEYDESIVTEMQEFCDSITTSMGISSVDSSCKLYLIYSDDMRAFQAPTDNGFALCITTGLLSRKGVDADVLKGYVANAFAHGILRQPVRLFYDMAKKKRKDKLVEGSLITAFVATALVADPDAEWDWQADYNTDRTVRAIKSLETKQKESTEKFEFPYTADQIFEADLLAYRFMENQGLGEAYINGLKIFQSAADKKDPSSDIPDFSQRINFLNFASNYYE